MDLPLLWSSQCDFFLPLTICLSVCYPVFGFKHRFCEPLVNHPLLLLSLPLISSFLQLIMHIESNTTGTIHFLPSNSPGAGLNRLIALSTQAWVLILLCLRSWCNWIMMVSFAASSLEERSAYQFLVNKTGAARVSPQVGMGGPPETLIKCVCNYEDCLEDTCVTSRKVYIIDPFVLCPTVFLVISNFVIRNQNFISPSDLSSGLSLHALSISPHPSHLL